MYEDVRLTNTHRLQWWFRLFASLLVIAAEGGIALIIDDATRHGDLLWWPYPAFTLMVITILAIDGILSRKSQAARAECFSPHKEQANSGDQSHDARHANFPEQVFSAPKKHQSPLEKGI